MMIATVMARVDPRPSADVVMAGWGQARSGAGMLRGEVSHLIHPIAARTFTFGVSLYVTYGSHTVQERISGNSNKNDDCLEDC